TAHEGVGEQALVRREPPAERVGNAEMRRPALDVRGGRVRALDLLQRARERERVAGELRAHRVSEILALAADAEGEQLRDERGEDPGDDPHHQEDEEQRAGAAFLASPPAPPPPPPATPPPPPHPAARAVHQPRRTDAAREAGVWAPLRA